MENVHNFLITTLTKFLDNSYLKWDGLLSFAFIVATYFLVAMALNLHVSLCLDEIQQKDAYLTLTTATGIMALMVGK